MEELKKSFFNFPRVDSDLAVWFLFEGKEYEINQFNIRFGQSIDYKGQPQNETRGGQILLTLTEVVPENIYTWAMTSCTRDGKIEFRSKTTNSPLKVEFTNAYCVSFSRVIESKGGLTTAIHISSEEVSINGINLDNRWA